MARWTPTSTAYYMYDNLGNVSDRLNASQAIVSSDLYDAYGQRLMGTSSDPYGYKGQYGYYTDRQGVDTGLILCTYRYYDPESGQWLTRDPIGYAGGINLYGYVDGNPVSGVDPTGLAGPMSAGECAQLLAKINRIIAKLKEKDAHYDPVDDWFGHEFRAGGKMKETTSGSHHRHLLGLQGALVVNLAKYAARCKGKPPAPCEAKEWVTKKWKEPDPGEAIKDDSLTLFALIAGGALIRAADASLAALEAAAGAARRVLAPQLAP